MSDERRLERIETKVDDIVDHMADMSTTLAEQHISLDTHIARTNALQTIVISVNRKVTMAEGALKLLGIAAIIFEIYKAIK